MKKILSSFLTLTLLACGGGSSSPDNSVTPPVPVTAGICGSGFVMPSISYLALDDEEVGDSIPQNAYLPTLSRVLPSSCSGQAIYSSNNLPAGLTIASTSGAISGTLSSASQGVFNVTLAIQGYASATTATAYNISSGFVSCVPAGYVMPAVSYTPASISADQGVAIQQLTPTFSSPLPSNCASHEIQWTHNGLPAGLQMSSSGVISGTPTSNGVGSFGASLLVFGAGSSNPSISYVIRPAFNVEINGAIVTPGADGIYTISSGQSLKITGSNLMGSNSTTTVTSAGSTASTSMQIHAINGSLYHITPASLAGNVLSITFTTFPKTLKFRFV